ncbi:transmembrane protein 199 [Scaptodrosophila lebanonensis]|uniref:Transmembrane protein 199 n=1 Tax=Drosophila lebanonensis TaxID=7225 RepID=A0A6J2SXB7_DROLE|nr:transmembrane protein 199 [Scaptodrosophila lebanonensis]
MLKSTIIDTRIRLRPSKKLLDLLDAQKEHFKELPDNVAQLLKSNGYVVPLGVQIIKANEKQYKRPTIDVVLLEKLTADVIDDPLIAKSDSEATEEDETPEEDQDQRQQPKGPTSFLYLSDLHWLNTFMSELRSKNICNVFLYQIIESSELILPENELKPRNPELEARCQRLREEQQNREYHKMTKNVDAGLKHYPEDTIAYQMKSINKQIIAVAQFIFSVAAGFVFGFLGINLIVGGLPFGFRLLLGVICALVIALAEMYFLAKKLHEYDEVLDAPKRKKPEPPTTSKGQRAKQHAE